MVVGKVRAIPALNWMAFDPDDLAAGRVQGGNSGGGPPFVGSVGSFASVWTLQESEGWSYKQIFNSQSQS